MKNRNVPLSVVFILIGIIVIGIVVGVIRYISLIEARYKLLLNNTTMLVDNITKKFTSLESDKVIKQLSAKVGVLKRDNAALRAQMQSSEHQLTNLCQKEKSCQARLSSVLREKKINKELDKQHPKEKRDIKSRVETKEIIGGNRGFLIKDGKSSYLSP